MANGGSGEERKPKRLFELFIGRKADKEAVVKLLELPLLDSKKHKARMITLCGEAGVGKTRLAQAVASSMIETGRFPGGVFEVVCDRVTDARGLALTILKKLGMYDAEVIPSPSDALVEFLKEQEDPMLLLLDGLDATNSDEAKTLLKNCLAASSSLIILTTCRRPLDLGKDEHCFTVEPMIPVEAAELFMRYIPYRKIQAELRRMSSEQRVKLFSQILDLTERIPVCLILAARRLVTRGQELKIKEFDSQILLFLEMASEELMKVVESPELKSLPEESRALRASLDLSYSHLSESVQQVFARMSFFPGGLSREYDDLWELLGDDWVDAAEEMVRYSLARYDRLAERYTMLSLVIDYAREKLEQGESDSFRHKVAEFWAEFARWHDLMMDVGPVQESASQLLVLSDEPSRRQQEDVLLESDSFVALAEENDNVLHAAEWALHSGDEAGLGILDAMEDYLTLSVQWYMQEKLYHLALAQRRQLARTDPQEYMPDLAMTLNNTAELMRKTRNFGGARPHLQEALEIYRRLARSQPDAYMPALATTLNNMGILLRDMDFPDEALKHHEEALDIRRKLIQASPNIHMPVLAITLGNMGVLLNDMGHPDKALKHYQEALETVRRLFVRYPAIYALKLLNTLRDMMEVYRKLGMDDEAAECEREIGEIMKTLG